MRCSQCSQNVKPVVAVDIDGTLGDYHTHFTDFCIGYHEISMPVMPYDGSGDFEDYLGLTRQQYREAKLAYRQGGQKRSMPEYGGAREFVASLRAAGVEVWIATTRPWQRLDNIDPDTREWLRRHDIGIDGLLYGDDKYEQLCEHLDADRVVGVIDDLLEQCELAINIGLPAVQVKREHNVATQFFPRLTLDEAEGWFIAKANEWRQKNDSR